MQRSLILLLVFCLFGVVSINAQILTISGETELFKYTIEFKDSLMVGEYKDSSEMLQKEIEISLYVLFSEMMIKEFDRYRVNFANRHVIYDKIKLMEKAIDQIPEGEKDRKKIIKSRNALAKVWHERYAPNRFDWIDGEYPKK